MQISANSTILVPPRPLSQSEPVAPQSQEHCRGTKACHHGDQNRSTRALGVFRQEVRASLNLQFHARLGASQQQYLQNANPASADDVAAETLGTAKQIVTAAPMRSGKAIISMKASVREAASFAQQVTAATDDRAELDDAVAKIDDGLNRLADEASANQESRSSVLDVNMRNKQRSTIRIRTQEGDIVRFDLKRVDRLSASDVSVSNEDGTTSTTEVAMSSRTRMALKVKGDLNENEMAAIQAVFDQAEQMANEFFGGDIAAAFNAAQGFEFDAEQLARVNMRFRMRQVSNISYTETVRTQPQPVVESAQESVESTPLAPTAPDVAPRTDMPVRPAATETPVVDAPPEQQPPVNEPAIVETNALSGFFDLVSDFLRAVGDGFEGSAGIRLHYSESFKLELLRTVIQTTAPADADNAAAAADEIIGSIADTQI